MLYHNRECKNSIREDLRLFDSYNKIIEGVANRTCKFVFVDGATALEAEHLHCNTVVKTGSPTFFGGGISFILPWNSSLTSKFGNATIELRGDGNLPALDDYAKDHAHCSHSSETVLTFRMLAAFFISAFVACALIFLEMVLDPQGPSERFLDEDEVVDSAAQDGDSVNGNDDDDIGDVEDPNELRTAKCVATPSSGEFCVSDNSWAS